MRDDEERRHEEEALGAKRDMIKSLWVCKCAVASSAHKRALPKRLRTTCELEELAQL